MNAIVIPESETELADVIAGADAPFSIIGGGTRAIGQTPGLTRLSTTGLSGVKLYEPGALTLVVGAGTPIAEIETLLAAEHQRLAFEPMDARALLGREGRSTIGGVIASNASGPRRVAVGAARDFMLGVRFVDGSGQIVSNGGRVMKNVTGYDMVKLLSGSRGMLGVMSEVSLKVMPIPETSQTLRIATVSDDMAVQAMSRALGSPYDVSGAAHIPGFGTVLRLEGFADSVAYRAAQLQDKLSDFGTVDLIEFDWTRVRDVQDLADWDGDIWRVHVKPSDGPGLVAATGGNAIYDWGGGLVWLGTMAGTDIRPHLAGLDGHATLFCTRDPGGIPIFHPENPVVQKITDGLKDRFDPRGLFNPRK